MLELLRQYFIKPLWEMLFIHFSMPLRAILIVIFLGLVLWLIIRLKNFWKETFRLFLEILLLPEYFFSKNKGIVPEWLNYGDFLNRIAVLIIPLKENETSKPIRFYWISYPVLFILIIFFPLLSCREKIKNSAPSVQFIDKTFLAWTSFEEWLLTGESKEQSDYYLDFVSHKIGKNETLESICNLYKTGDDGFVCLDKIVWLNRSAYPTISEETFEPEWTLIVPVMKSLKVKFDSPADQNYQNIYRVRTRNKSGLYIRSEKDLDSPAVAFVPEEGEVILIYFDNQTVTVKGRRGKWCRVKTKDGKEGWAWGWYITNAF